MQCPSLLRRHATPLAVATIAALAASAGADAAEGLALAKAQGCLACHAVDSKLVGPAYRDVAEKYKGQPDAPATLTQHIREGGSGRWGEIPMPPQKQLSEAQAKTLAQWILAGAK
jgi:cytochrome c